MNRFRKAIVEGNVDALAALLPSPYINTYVLLHFSHFNTSSHFFCCTSVSGLFFLVYFIYIIFNFITIGGEENILKCF